MTQTVGVETPPKQSFIQRWRINEKAMFFFANASIYASHTFALDSFAKEAHLNYYMLALVTALSFFNMIGSMGASHINDKTKNPRFTAIISALGYLACFFTLSLINITTGKIPRAVFVILYTAGNFFQSGMYPSLDVGGLALNYKLGASKEAFGKQRMWGVIGHSFTTILLEYMGSELRKEKRFVYRCPRLSDPAYKDSTAKKFLCMPFDFLEFLIGAVLDWSFGTVFYYLIGGGFEPIKNIYKARKGTMEVILLVVFTLTFMLITYLTLPKNVMIYLTKKDQKKDKSVEEEQHDAKEEAVQRKSMLKTFEMLLKNIDLLLFYSLVMIMGIGRCIISYYMVFYTQATKHQCYAPLSRISKPFTVFALAKAFAEAVCYPLEKWLIRVLGSSQVMCSLGVFLALLRLIVYATIPTWLLVPVGFINELFKGISSGLFFCGGIRFLRDTAPGDALGTAQGLLSGIYIGLSGLFGGLIAGIIIHCILYNNVSFKAYKVLEDVKERPEVDAECHLAAIQTFLIVVSITLLVFLGIYIFYAIAANKKKKRQGTENTAGTKTL